MGTENKDKDRGEAALRKIDANTLAACAKTRESGAGSGCGCGSCAGDGGMGCRGWMTRVRSGVQCTLYGNGEAREKGLEGRP
jgi:hypothetical protein